MKRVLSSVLVAAGVGGVVPGLALVPGDIALVGYNADGSGADSVAFVALAPIPPGQVIYFTDNEWNGQPLGAGGGFVDTAEGVVPWISPLEGLPAGSVVVIQTMDTVPTPLNAGSIGQVNFPGFNLDPDNGDAVLAYQGSNDTTPTVVLAALGNTRAADTGNNLAGSGLTAGTGNALFFTSTLGGGTRDIAGYIGLRNGLPTLADYLPLLANQANWATEDAPGDQSGNGLAPDLPFPTTPFQTGGSAERLTLSFNPASAPENGGGGAILGTVTRTGTVIGALTVTVTSSDPSEAVVLGTATIANGQASRTFQIDAVDDAWPDGPQTVQITVSHPNYLPDTKPVTITDAGLDEFTLVVNEAYYGIDPNLLDANQDGVADTSRPSDDEFVELVNLGSDPLTLDFYQMLDNSGAPFHTFPEGTLLAPGCALLVFGGGNLPEGTLAGRFGTAEVQFANGTGGGLYLDDTGDLIRILNDLGEEAYSVTLPDQSSQPAAGSYTLATDADPANGYVYHTTTAGGTRFSPGNRADGSDFCTVTAPLTLTLNVPSLAENGAPVAAGATVSRPTAGFAPLVVRLESSDPSELAVPATVTIDPGETSIDIELTPVNDTITDGTQAVTLRARASGHLNTATTVNVTDDGDLPPFTGLVINELDPTQSPTDSAEFIELFNTTAAAGSLNGLVLVLFDGAAAGDSVYRAIDLSGHTIPAGGFFVVGSSAVPGVNLIGFTTNGLQNGTDAAAIYAGSPADFPTGKLLASVTNQLIDAVVYGPTPDPTLLATLAPGQTILNEDAQANATSHALARVPNGGPAFVTTGYLPQKPSPGTTNVLPGGFESWAQENDIPGQPAGGDADHDGLDNLLEYALGLDPTTPDPAPATLTGPSGRLLSFTKNPEAIANGDVIWTIETSPDLEPDSWTAVTPDTNTPPTIIAYTLPAGLDAIFARLVVTQQQ